MRFKGIKKVHTGRFISRYDIAYETRDGQEKIYEMISRNHDLQTYEDLHGKAADSVVMILTDESGEHILLNREFRMAMGVWVYNFVAGLIDPGETPEEAGRRELREETGLELVSVEDVLAGSYSAIGFANERNICMIGTARGTIRPSDSVFEEIETGWYSKEEVRKLLRTESFAARTEAYCYLWSKETK